MSLFIPESLKPLPALIAIDGMARSLKATHSRLFALEIINNVGGITKIQTWSLYMPGMDCFLLSLQDLLRELWEQEREDGQLIVTRQYCILKLPNQGSVTIPYDPITFQ